MLDILKLYRERKLTIDVFSKAPKSVKPKLKLIAIVKKNNSIGSYLMYNVTLRETEQYIVFVNIHFNKTPIESDGVSSTFYRDFGWFSRHEKTSHIRDEGDEKAINLAYHVRKLLKNGLKGTANLECRHHLTPTQEKFYFTEKYWSFLDEIKNHRANKLYTIKYF